MKNIKLIMAIILVSTIVLGSLVGCTKNNEINNDAQVFLEETETSEILNESFDENLDDILNETLDETPENVARVKNPTNNPPKLQVGEEIRVKVGMLDGVPVMSMLGAMQNTKQLNRIDVEFEIIKSLEEISEGLMNKDFDAMILPTELAAELYEMGADYKLAATTVWGTDYLLSIDNINSVSELTGRKIYLFDQERTQEKLLQYLLSNKGLNPQKDIENIYLDDEAEIETILDEKQKNIALMDEPLLSSILLNNSNIKVVFDFKDEWEKLSETGRGYPQYSLMISGELIGDNPRITDAIVGMTDRSIVWINENPRKAGRATEDLSVGLQRDIVINAIERSNMRFVPAIEAKYDIELYLRALNHKLPDNKFYFIR